MFAYVWPFLIYELILFVVCYIIVDYGQKYLYDETSGSTGTKVALGSMILAAMLTWTKSNFATMFTSDLMYTVLQAIVWFGVFVLVFRFQPWHGLGLSLATMLVIAGLATIVTDSMLRRKTEARIDTKVINKPLRRPSAGGPPPTTTAPTPAPATAPR